MNTKWAYKIVYMEEWLVAMKFKMCKEEIAIILIVGHVLKQNW